MPRYICLDSLVIYPLDGTMLVRRHLTVLGFLKALVNRRKSVLTSYQFYVVNISIIMLSSLTGALLGCFSGIPVSPLKVLRDRPSGLDFVSLLFWRICLAFSQQPFFPGNCQRYRLEFLAGSSISTWPCPNALRKGPLSVFSSFRIALIRHTGPPPFHRGNASLKVP